MLRRYGDKALEESTTCADQLEAEGDRDGAATWGWIARAIEPLVNTKPSGPVHRKHLGWIKNCPKSKGYWETSARLFGVFLAAIANFAWQP
jgi:hypothetical protein